MSHIPPTTCPPINICLPLEAPTVAEKCNRLIPMWGGLPTYRRSPVFSQNTKVILMIYDIAYLIVSLDWK
jgi:hypothetical protein